MAVLIGHASIGDGNKSKGGLAGDQTGKEVCTRAWYDKGWDAVLRPKTSALAENSARLCEILCENENVGYDQNQRNSLWTTYKKTLQISPTVKVECDCSSLMTYCAILGGANIVYGSNAPTTSTMVSKYKASGNYEVLTDEKYLKNSDYLKRGDILVRESNPKIDKKGHTVMALTDGAKANTSSYSKAVITIPQATIKKGAKGDNVEQLQIALNTLFACGLAVDGSFGTKTYNAVRNTQQTLKNAGLYTSTVDGSFGPNNRKALVNYAMQKGYTVR